MDLAVVCHVSYEGVGIGGPNTAAGYADFYTEYHTLVGTSTSGHLVSILCHGVFERFPKARLMLMEGGLAQYLGYLWRLDTNWKGCRTEIPWCRRPPSEYVWEHVRFTTQPLETPEDASLLALVLNGLRAWDTLCFASDYPHWDFDEPTRTLSIFPAEWRDAIAYRNAIDFYRLPVPVTV
jgi:predicted TIM-barrel fold metal-dependent hydrolase